jgi:hypothetical protein
MTEEEYELEQKYIDIQRTIEFLKYDLDGIGFVMDSLCEDGTNNMGAKLNGYQLINQAYTHLTELTKLCKGW